MDASERRAQLVSDLQQTGRVDVAESAAALDAAQMTIRRDLDVLVSQGVARRVRGGAVSLLMRGEELPFAMRQLESGPSKQRMAELVATLVQDGEAVVLDSGTTGLAVAHALSARRLTIMPLSLPAASVLSTSPSTTLLVPAGTARFGEGSLVGPMTEASVRSLRFDIAVLTCCGLSAAGGVTAHDVQDAAVKRAAIDASARTVLVAEGAKFARTALAVVSPVSRVDVLVTDDEAPEAAVQQWAAEGIDVRRA